MSKKLTRSAVGCPARKGRKRGGITQRHEEAKKRPAVLMAIGLKAKKKLNYGIQKGIKGGTTGTTS